MDSVFSKYCDRVCSYVNRATPAEKQALSSELSSHLEDHAQALMDIGYSPHEASQRAVLAMGSAEEIGAGLNRTYSRFWLIVYRTAKVLTVIVLLLSLFPLLSRGEWIFRNIQAEYAPMSVGLGNGCGNTAETDIRIELPGHRFIAKIYAYAVDSSSAGDTVDVFVCIYPKNILRCEQPPELSVSLCSGAGSTDGINGFSSAGVRYYQLSGTLLPAAEAVGIRLENSRIDMEYELDIGGAP